MLAKRHYVRCSSMVRCGNPFLILLAWFLLGFYDEASSTDASNTLGMNSNSLKSIASTPRPASSPGPKIVPPADPEFRAKYEAAIAYLKQTQKAREIIQALDSDSPIRIEIRPWKEIANVSVHDAHNAYVPETGRLYWSPDHGLEWQSQLGIAYYRSPAISLLHELAHAYHNMIDPVRYSIETIQTGGRWNKEEERRTILEIENVVAGELGEPKRYWHNSAWLGNEGMSASYGARTNVLSRIPSFSGFRQIPANVAAVRQLTNSPAPHTNLFGTGYNDTPRLSGEWANLSSRVSVSAEFGSFPTNSGGIRGITNTDFLYTNRMVTNFSR